MIRYRIPGGTTPSPLFPTKGRTVSLSETQFSVISLQDLVDCVEWRFSDQYKQGMTRVPSPTEAKDFSSSLCLD
jgi:hypothetical protein